MMRTRTDQTIFSPLELVCILMVYMFCNLSDASTLGGGVVGFKAFVCVVRTGTNLSFLSFSPPINRVQMKTLIKIPTNGSGFFNS